jgi:hypothetical protein
LLWDIAEGICILARGGHRGIHPGANVAVDLLIWLAFVPCIVFLLFLGLASNLGGLLTSSFGGSYGSGYTGGSYGYYRRSYGSSYGGVYDDLNNAMAGIVAKGQATIGLSATVA